MSHHSPGDEDHEVWSAGEDESADDGGRSLSGSKRKREKLSVSCETCKQRKVKCDRGHPACKYFTSCPDGDSHVLMVLCRRLVLEESFDMCKCVARHRGDLSDGYIQVYLPRKKPGLRAGYGRELGE